MIITYVLLTRPTQQLMYSRAYGETIKDERYNNSLHAKYLRL